MKMVASRLLVGLVLLGLLLTPWNGIFAFSPNTSLAAADASFIGENADDESGYVVSSAGDVNGDGYADFLIGAYQYNSYQGKTYLILGSAAVDWGMDFDLAGADASFIGENTDDYSGYTIAAAGDVNQDNYDDFLIGAHNNDQSAAGAGKTYLILGRAAADWGTDFSLAGSDASFLGEAGMDESGYSVASAGDVNGDNFTDILIGAKRSDAGGSWRGQTYLILGKAAGWANDTSLSTADASFWGENDFDYAGCAVNTAGDVNGDGYDDFLIGAYFYSNYTGKAYLILGKATGWAQDTLLSTADASFTGEAEDDYAGFSLATAGDVNNDGYADFLIGAYMNSQRGDSAGQAYLWWGKAAADWGDRNLSTADASFLAYDGYDYAGYSVAPAGDVNNDSYADFLIGAPGARGSSVGAGKTYLILGSASPGWGMDYLLENTDASFLGEALNDNSGFSVASPGDVNHDGCSDLLIGAKFNDDGGDRAGQSYLWLGSTIPGITVSAISDNTTETGGTATFTIVLDTLPSAGVTIDLSSDDTSEGTVAPSSVSFTTVDWDTPQTVTVTGVDDAIDDGDIDYWIVTAAAVSTDADYNTLDADDVAVTNLDNDTAGITVSAISDNTTESGGTASFTLVLDTQPVAAVTINLSSSDATEGTVSPSGVVFSTADWAAPQTVTVTGVDDDLHDGDIDYQIVTAAAVSTDPVYNTLNADDVAVINSDNDDPGITVSAISDNTTEAGGTATFTIVLDTQPAAAVSLGLSSSDTTEGTVSPASVGFSTTDWDDPQTVTVTGVDDVIDDGDISYAVVIAPAVSTDPDYHNLNPDNVTVINLDDDGPGITLSALSADTSETGSTATFTIVLNTAPSAEVRIDLSSADPTEGTVTPDNVTFTSANWDMPQTVTVTGVDDDLNDGNVVYTIVIAAAVSTDPDYNNLDAEDVSVTNQDDDIASLPRGAGGEVLPADPITQLAFLLIPVMALSAAAVYLIGRYRTRPRRR